MQKNLYTALLAMLIPGTSIAQEVPPHSVAFVIGPSGIGGLFYAGNYYKFDFLAGGEIGLSEKNYSLGGTTTVCADNALSGTSGTGACSWHGGVSHETESIYSRFSLNIGGVYHPTEKGSVYLSLVLGSYIEVVDMGESTEKTKAGISLGAGYEAMPNVTILGFYSTESRDFRAGLAYHFN